MLSSFDKYQQTLIASFWALSDAQPPHKSEMRNATDITGLGKALFDISKATGKYSRSAFDHRKRGTQLPRQRKVRAS
ncbi:hypothetical protein [Mycobacterium sp. CnD-18-1]|uniref:hypothetical protein n=1 Tax=Mycobacterium sp. CnD-18-1 TaxID=2917744 RepID=UPI001EF1B52B|nr:hypothetical protein [Mycobacterium sp. CnD-18-1]MCG7607181.1 hypothetical protein [Mycobacterium sp. CnD-18-1]